MKAFLWGSLVVLVLMYVYAERTLDHPKNDGIVRMLWTTDLNPARTVQTGLFDKLNPGLEVSVDPGVGGDDTKTIVQCATGVGPDIMDISTAGDEQSLVDAGILLDLTPYAKQMGFDPSRTYASIRSALLVDGKLYRFPCNVTSDAVIYNKKIFDDHGVPYPKPDWTYDDFVKIAERIRDTPSKSGEKEMPIANYSNLLFFEDLLIGGGGRFFSPDGLVSRFDSPEAISAMQFYHDLMWVHKVIPTAAETAAMSSQGGWGSQGIDWFSDGKAAMILIGRWYIVQLPQYKKLAGNLGTVTLPHVGNRPSCGIADTRAAGINVKSPHWREALKFLQYLASPQYGQVIVDDGDSLPPDPDLGKSGKSLVDDLEPNPAFHQPFVDAIRQAKPLDFSPFMDAPELERWIQEQVDNVENQVLTPAQAMHTLANEVNAEVRKNLERRPDFQRRYEKLTGHPYSPDWWRTYSAEAKR